VAPAAEKLQQQILARNQGKAIRRGGGFSGGLLSFSLFYHPRLIWIKGEDEEVKEKVSPSELCHRATP
jgi:hypothetical protein